MNPQTEEGRPMWPNDDDPSASHRFGSLAATAIGILLVLALVIALVLFRGPK